MSPPSHSPHRSIFSVLSVFFLALLAILCCPPAVSAEDAHPEYGTVIGIGVWYQLSGISSCITVLLQILVQRMQISRCF